MTVEDQILKQLSGLKTRLRLLRLPLFVAGALAFLAGAWWSFSHLRLSIADLEPGFLALLIIVMMPASLLYSGVGLVIIGRSGGIHLRLGEATVIACYASVAEMLPLPGGAIVRAGALMSKGVGLIRSVALVVANSILWIALAVLGTAFTIFPYSTLVALTLLAVGTAITFATVVWLVWRAGIRVALYSFVHRIAGIVLLSLRLYVAFQVIGVELPFVKALPVTLAVITGSAASITPAGLGINEVLGALVANAVGVAPAAAFLAVGLDRLLFVSMSSLGALGARGVSSDAPVFRPPDDPLGR